MRNLKEVLAEVTTQTKVNLRKAGVVDQVAALTEVRNPFRNLRKYWRWVCGDRVVALTRGEAVGFGPP